MTNLTQVLRIHPLKASGLLVAAAALQQQDYAAGDRQLGRLTNKIQSIALTPSGAIQLFKGPPKEALAAFQQAAQLSQNSASALYSFSLAATPKLAITESKIGDTPREYSRLN